jgi:hypothetical protein
MGKYYAKHTINHLVDSRSKINELNENYKKFTINNAVSYLGTTTDTIDEKIKYLNSLTHDNFRIGRKYKYDCSLNNSQIKKIIKSIGDEILFATYFGHSIQEDNQNTLIITIVCVIILFACLLIFGLANS